MRQLKVQHLVALPGERTRGYIAVSGTDLALPVTLICGNNEGKTVLITGGIHNAEYVGIEAAIQLGHTLHPNHINGNVIIVHLTNRNGFENRTMSLVHEDGKNLNRVFPGRKDGTLAERLSYFIETEIFSLVDYHIDLHCGDGFEDLTPFVFCQGNAKEEVCKCSEIMAKAVRVPYIVKSSLNSGGAYNYAGSLGIPGILLERGASGMWTQQEVDAVRMDVKHVLQTLGVMEKDYDIPNWNSYIVDSVIYENAKHTGCWYPEHRAGDKIRKGDLLGIVKDYFGNILERCIAKVTGVVLYQTASLCILNGDPMIACAEIKKEETY